MLIINTDCTPDNKAPYWVLQYIKRDIGTTRQTRYRHWRNVLLSDMAATIWNKLTHDMTAGQLTELQRGWYPVHYRSVIDKAPIADVDKDLLRYKLYSHLLRLNERQAA